MKYKNIKKGIFISRPNRFIAQVELDGSIEICHVKNTGRCKELLIPGATVYVEKSDNPLRKTQFDLVSVYKGEKLFNIDSSAPNIVFGEWLEKSGELGEIELIKPELSYKNSRFDFYIETTTRKIFAEVKGVTLEDNGVMKFPDAPTIRGLKHINELTECVKDGYDAYIIFVVQCDKEIYFTPNRSTHKEFADALIYAKENGVKIMCLYCNVTEDEIEIKGHMDIRL